MNLSSIFNVKGLLLALALGVAGGSFVTHAIDQNRYDALVIKHAKADAARADAARKAQEAAVAAARTAERKSADLAQASALRAAVADQKIVTRTRTIIEKVPVYVTPAQDRVACVSFGLVRLLDAAVLGVDPASLQLPAGVTDDTCSPFTASDLARSVVGNYGIAEQNAEQLNQLIADITERIRIANNY